jgi:hypothetical protein
VIWSWQWGQHVISSVPAVYTLDQVKYRHPVADWGKKTCPVGSEQQVSSAVNGTEQVGKLDTVSRVMCSSARYSYLEISLHGEADYGWCCRRIVAGHRL